MKSDLNTHAVIVEPTDIPTLLLVKRPKFIKAKIIQCGSDVEQLRPGDTVMCYNEGYVVSAGSKKGRVIQDKAIIIKF